MLNPVGPFSGVNRNNLLSDGKVCWSLADVAHKRLLIYDHKVILWRYRKEERVMVVCFLAKKIINCWYRQAWAAIIILLFKLFILITNRPE